MNSLFKKRTEPFAYHRYYLLAQKRWAEKMQRATDGLSKTKLVCGLLFFTVLASGYLIYNLYRTFCKEAAVSEFSKTKTINLKNYNNGR